MAFSQQTITASITHGGLQRDYILYVPANYTGTTAVPLLFNFHGYTSNATEQMWYGDFRAIADTAGFLIVHPEGKLDGSGNTHFNVGWGGSSINDVGFTSALIDSLLLDYSIDEDRVYSTGMSNGGFMSYQLACELSDRIAAIASVTGSMNMGWFNSCNPNHPMPIMEIHGTADGNVPYATIPSIMDFWANFYQRIFNFREIRYFDIKGEYTGLTSRAMTAPDGKIRIPLNEEGKAGGGQIEEYLRAYNGEGIQHIAFSCDDLPACWDRLKALGTPFAPPPPKAYYDMLEERLPGHGEPVGELQARGILLDGSTEDGDPRLLLQIFSQTMIGPVFFEFIQRKKDEGFGEGNFTALFKSIERDQIERGVLTMTEPAE